MKVEKPPSWVNHNVRNAMQMAGLVLKTSGIGVCQYEKEGYLVYLIDADGGQIHYGIYQVDGEDMRLLGKGKEISLERRLKQLGLLNQS